MRSEADAHRRVAVLAPMRSELRPLVKPLSLRRGAAGDERLYAGAIAGVEVVATTTGIGPPRAARAAEHVLDSAQVDRLVVVGIAGGVGSGVVIGELVVPERVVDLATGAEYRPSRLGEVVPRGTLVTSDGLLSDPDELARMERRGVVAIDMETAAIAAVCERRGCPWSVFRAISDRAGDPAVGASVFALAGADGSPDLPAVARFVLTGPWRIPLLVRLARDLRRATNTAASAAVTALEAL
jgi:adenosylhomocysteine nucleosidase